MKTTRIFRNLLLLLTVSATAGFGQMNNNPPSNMTPVGTIRKAVCVLNPIGNSQVAGIITFTEVQGGVLIEGKITGLPPNSAHGIHIHEFGDCSSPDGTAAGPHYNPEGTTHGGPMDMKRHNGDLGNIEADADGVATISYTDAVVSLKGDKSVIGRSIIIHEKMDDMKTQPTGNSGARIACGVIGLAK
jgi:superoxide dismutase, Cu-Zn family